MDDDSSISLRCPVCLLIVYKAEILACGNGHQVSTIVSFSWIGLLAATVNYLKTKFIRIFVQLSDLLPMPLQTNVPVVKPLPSLRDWVCCPARQEPGKRRRYRQRWHANCCLQVSNGLAGTNWKLSGLYTFFAHIILFDIQCIHGLVWKKWRNTEMTPPDGQGNPPPWVRGVAHLWAGPYGHTKICQYKYNYNCL